MWWASPEKLGCLPYVCSFEPESASCAIRPGPSTSARARAKPPALIALAQACPRQAELALAHRTGSLTFGSPNPFPERHRRPGSDRNLGGMPLREELARDPGAVPVPSAALPDFTARKPAADRASESHEPPRPGSDNQVAHLGRQREFMIGVSHRCWPSWTPQESIAEPAVGDGPKQLVQPSAIQFDSPPLVALWPCPPTHL